MPSITKLSEIDSICQLLQSIEMSVATAMANCLECGAAEVNKWHRFVGWAAPPEDCCPSIAVWADNLRPNPIYTNAGGKGCPSGWLIDVTIRISDCYVDMDATGNALHPAEIEEDSCRMYGLMHCGYLGFFCQWASGNITELDSCEPLDLGPASTYSEGGCGGIEYTLTVNLDR